ncbi:MAG: M1 family metallopeptidase [Saprospiraceae bacterium]|nr:M1 family metallopeptidase [Saprospiraceae bacterium]MDW8229196.1 M1 family metallopeptidase [Saprospiraceae bacterium]
MLKNTLLLCLCLATAVKASAQALYMPRNLQRAYAKQTRSWDGRPGPKYWQNRAEYRISASLLLPERTVSGQADIRYFNRSPDTLKFIRLKLAHDLYRKNAPRAFDLNPKAVTDEGVEVTELRVNGIAIEKSRWRRFATFLDVPLEEAQLPGQSLQLSIAWRFEMPPAAGAPREGVYDSTTWFVPYWYPQIAVYDDLRGWADAPYTGLQEMYNDFADYWVRITTPAHVMVWATGVWQNPQEVLQDEFYRRYQRAQTSDSVLAIFSKEDYASKAPFFRASDTHTFEFRAENVPDFAFATSSYYLWDAVSTVVEPNTGRRAFVSAAYKPASPDFKRVCRAAADALHLMSRWLPGYPYPYPTMTVFNGSGGMEFPMMCNNGSTHPGSPVGLTVHETAHTYFPFLMGINEQDYAWMDEGWAAFLDVLVTDSLEGKSTGRLRNYPDFAGTDADMPPMVPSRHLANPAYRVAAYNRPQAAYFALYQMLGYERFHRCMTEYIERWKGKHPQPFDFFFTWNAVAGENLDWFWKPWFFDWGYPDLSVAGVTKKRVVIENTGTMPQTVSGTITYADGTQQTFWHTADVWKGGRRIFVVPLKKRLAVRQVQLGHPQISDADASNNVWPR